MKRLILMLFVLTIIFASCETTEDNIPGFQTQIDSAFFKALDSRSDKTEGKLTLQGFTNDESITIFLNDFSLKDYLLGGERQNSAIYESFTGEIYKTNPHGSGSVTLTDRCVSCGTYTGVFNFTAVNETLTDTVVMSKGVFFEVSTGAVDEDEDGDTGDGTLTAVVNDVPFIPITVTAVETTNAIVIAGGTTTATILLRVPLGIEVGSYDLPMSGFTVSYTENGVTLNATEGNISVISHDTAAKTMTGTFAFLTETDNISSGQFNISYQ